MSERVGLLRPAHPDTSYVLRLDDRGPRAHAAPDLVKSILTNLLQNAAEATGMMAASQSGTAIIFEVAGSQHACRVEPVATRSARSFISS